jgi:alcohol dehydrogenase class IV
VSPREHWTLQDGERLLAYGAGEATRNGHALLESRGFGDYALITTHRASASVPRLAELARVIAIAEPGLVVDVAASLREQVSGHPLVALGGGRVIDVAKAMAAARGGGARAMAIPTTLSGAEMTRGHRHATGVDEATPRVRCAVVVCDPVLAASQPEPELAASALNALGHAFEGPCTTAAHPVAELVAHDAARRLVGGFAGAEPEREELALGALLAGYTIDSAGFGLHHVMSQTLVRLGLAGHGPANAVLLAHTTGALAWRFPAQHEALAEALGDDPATVAARLRERTGATSLRDLGIDEAALDRCADVAAERRELDHTPPRADRAELWAIYHAAL